MNKRTAVYKFVNEMNCFETRMIEELMDHDPEDWTNVTVVEDGEDVPYPTWGWMWQPDDYYEIGWIDEHLEEISKIGFVVLESDKYGPFIGMDAGGFDFYEAFWEPLYDAMGMKWHVYNADGGER